MKIALLSALLLVIIPPVQAHAPGAAAATGPATEAIKPIESLYSRYVELTRDVDTPELADAVIEKAQALIREDPDFAPAYVLLARAHRERGQSGVDVAGSYQAARTAAESALKIDPGLIAARGELGSITNRQQRPHEGRSELIEGFGPVTRGLGYFNYRTGSLAEAWHWLKLAQHLYPTEDWSLRYSSYVAHLLGDYAEAERLLKELLRLHGNAIGDRAFLATVLAEKGDEAGASAVTRQLFADVDEGRGTGAEIRPVAVLALEQGNRERASRYAQRAVQLAPNDGRVLALGGYLLGRRSNPYGGRNLLAQATEQWEAAIRGGASDFQPALELARIEATRGDQSRSLRYLRTAVSAGFRNHRALMRDPMLSILHSSDDFSQLLANIQNLVNADRAKLAYPLVGSKFGVLANTP